jgi:hypothetical protein
VNGNDRTERFFRVKSEFLRELTRGGTLPERQAAKMSRNRVNQANTPMNISLHPRPAKVDPLQRTVILTIGLCLFLASAGWAQVKKPAATPKMERAPVTVGELEYEVRGDGEPVLLIHGSHIAGSFLPLMDQTSFFSKHPLQTG